MKSMWTFAFFVLASTGFAQEPGGEPVRTQGGKLLAEIDCQEVLSFGGDAKMFSQYTKVSITLFRSDQQGQRVNGMTLKADQVSSESTAQGGLRMLTLKGNVRVEQKDGSVITAKEAVIDFSEETITFKMDVGIVIPK